MKRSGKKLTLPIKIKSQGWGKDGPRDCSACLALEVDNCINPVNPMTKFGLALFKFPRKLSDFYLAPPVS